MLENATIDIESENRYISAVIKNMPEIKKGEAHVIQRGECLWSIAKKNIEQKTNRKASNAEISDYMLRMAKANGLDTYEKMNNVKLNQTIYLPEGETTQNISQSKNVNNPSKTTGTEKVITEAERKALEAKNSLAAVIETINNDPTVHISKAFGQKVYHVYNEYQGGNYKSYNHPIMSVSLDENKKIRTISFNNEKDLCAISYDYHIDNKGKVTYNFGSFSQRETAIIQLTKTELQALEKLLMEKIQP